MPNLDPAKQEAFAGRLSDILNHGALNLALGLGYQSGALAALANLEAPADLETIAAASGLAARYLREWLGVMVSGRVVELSHDEAGRERFRLPPEHAAWLLGRHGAANLGVYTQEMPLLTMCAAQGVLEGLRSGRGLGWEHYPRFQAFMGELGDAKHQEVLLRKFLPSVDGGRLVEKLAAGGMLVCDLGCGQGLVSRLMARAFPEARFVGLDCLPEAIAAARDAAQAEGLANLEYQVADAAALWADPAWAGRYDYVTAFDAIHDQTDPAGALRSVAHMLKADGLFSMVDIAAQTGIAGNADHPMGPFLYAVSLMHCLPLGLGPDGAGAGLGMMWGRQKAEAMLAEAGFGSVAVEPIPEDSFNLHYLCRR